MNDVLAVIAQNSSRLRFIDTLDRHTLADVELPAQPHEVLHDADRQVLYCTSTYRSGFYDRPGPRAHELTVVDARTRRIVDTIDLAPEHAPHGLALDAARGLLYVSVEAGPAGDGAVVVVDVDRRTVLERINSRAPGPHWFAITPDGTKGYATNKEAPFVSVVDLVERRLAGTIDVAGSEGLAFTPDGSHVVIATPKLALGAAPAAAPNLSVFDTATDALVRTLPLPGPAVPVHITADGTLLAGQIRFAAPLGAGDVPRPLPGRVHIFSAGTDAGTFVPRGSVEVGPLPLTINSSPDAAFAYVSNTGGSTVTVIDLELDKAAGDIPIGAESGPHGLACVPSLGD
ncbi:YncE family protein [Streptomyces sp. NPDC059009]|uniref:YncE family protein n=1 Tax=Streptomyces sp. NPDC059009 TaxID=3346694 RepID=UPI00369A9215